MSRVKLERRAFVKLAVAAGAAGLAGIDSLNFLATDVSAAGVQDAWIPTNCHMCGGSTGILAHVVNGRVVKIEPNSANPIGISNISTDFQSLKSLGSRMCAKGNAAPMSLYDPDRVKRPLKRLGARGAGQWQEISYDQAVTEIATKLAGIKADSGPDKLVWFSEDASFVAIQQNFCNAFGTPNYHNHANTCDVGRKAAYLTSMGNDRPLADARNAKYILLFGYNPLGAMKWAHVPRILLDGLDRGAKLVVVDPRCSETAAKAMEYGGRWLPILPGTDGALALALANVIISERLYDSGFVANYTVGFDAFAAMVASKTPEWAAAITSIPAQTIRQVARELAATKPSIVDAWSGPVQHMNGTDATRAVAMLPGLLGQIDEPGTLLFATKQYPVYRVLPTPPGARVDGRGVKYPFAHSSGIYVEARDAMLTGVPYRPRAAVFVFQNFVLSVPNMAKNIEAIHNMELVVSVDTHMSETAMLADYVIPGTHFLERYELNAQWVSFPVVSLRQPVVQPIFGQKPEYEFVSDLARRMGYNMYPFSVSYEQFLDDALRAGPGIGLEELRALPGATWIGGATQYKKYVTSGFGTPTRKFEFSSAQMAAKGLNPLPDYVPTTDGVSAQYPLYLINWKEALHTHSRTMNNRWLMELHGENEVWINADRARSLGIVDGDMVTVENQYASARGRARVTGRIHFDVVGMTHGFGHSALGSVAKGKGIGDTQFLAGRADRVSGQAAHKDGAVRISR